MVQPCPRVLGSVGLRCVWDAAFRRTSSVLLGATGRFGDRCPAGCVSAFLCACECGHVRAQVHGSACVWVCTCVCTHVSAFLCSECTCGHVCVCVHVHWRVRACNSACTCVRVCISHCPGGLLTVSTSLVGCDRSPGGLRGTARGDRLRSRGPREAAPACVPSSRSGMRAGSPVGTSQHFPFPGLAAARWLPPKSGRPLGVSPPPSPRYPLYFLVFISTGCMLD